MISQSVLELQSGNRFGGTPPSAHACPQVPPYGTPWCSSSIPSILSSRPISILNLMLISQSFHELESRNRFRCAPPGAPFGAPWCSSSIPSILSSRPISIPSLKLIFQSFLELESRNEDRGCLMPHGDRTKTICPPPYGSGDIITVKSCCFD